MNKKFTLDSGYIEKVKKHIKDIYPNTRDIDIKIEKSPEKKFKSTIIVKTPKKKHLVAQKYADTYAYSLEKSQRAITKQIEKLKMKSIAKQNHHSIKSVEAA